jgi:hypothetical protein
MAFQPIPLLLSLRNQIAPLFRKPRPISARLRKTGLEPDAPLLMATYTEAVVRFTKAAEEFMEFARLLSEAQDAYQLWQKEAELVRLRREISSLKLVIPLLVEDSDFCEEDQRESVG